MDRHTPRNPLRDRVHRAITQYQIGARVVVESTNRSGRIMGYRFDDGLLLYIQYTTVEGNAWVRPEQVRLTIIERHGT